MIIEAGKNYRRQDGLIFTNARNNDKLEGCPWLLDAPDGVARDFNGDGTVPYPRVLCLTEEVAITNTPRPGDAPGSRDRTYRHKELGHDGTNFYTAQDGVRTPVEPSSLKTTKASLLDAAKAAVADRGLNYGKPEDNFRRIARLWSVYLADRVPTTDGSITPNDVAQMMALMKIARLENDPSHLDSWTDLAGYAACGAEISA